MPRTTVEIMIADWELECCAPPPVLGGHTQWKLEFIPTTEAPARDHLWTATHRPDGAVILDRDGIEAVWNAFDTPAPPAGIHTLHGYLAGTVHGGIVPDDLPPVSGHVQRIRMASYAYAPDPVEARTFRTVPGSLELRDVRECPRWFSHDLPGPGRRDTGVLIELAL